MTESKYWELLKHRWKYISGRFIFMVIPDEDTDNRMGIDFETTIFIESGYDNFGNEGYRDVQEGLYIWGEYEEGSSQAFPIANIEFIGKI